MPESDKFVLDLEAFGDLAIDSANIVVRKTSLGLLSGIVMDTPVDTGRARANWQTTIGAPASGQVIAWNGPGGAASAALTEGAARIEDVSGDVAIFLTNNVPYIEPLEFGHSRQAPGGMVRRNIARFHYLVQDAAQGEGGGI